MTLGSAKLYLALEIENNDILKNIHQKVVDSIKSVGLTPKNPEYKPHISLGKLVNSNNHMEDLETGITLEIVPKTIAVHKSIDFAKEI